MCQEMSDPAVYIHSLGRFSGTPGLHRIRSLLAALDNPQQGLKFIHVAGTNGKGSVCAMLDSVLRQAGLRTGLFTSPFLTRFTERVRVDGQEIPQADLIRLTARVRGAAGTLTLPPGESIGEFEFITALAMLYFAEMHCELVVLETGLGGEFDATNAIEPAAVTVITPISLDHTAVLGDTSAQIARAKAGIIKPGTTLVCAAGQPPEAFTVIWNTAYASSVSLHMPGEPKDVRCTLSGAVFTYAGRQWKIPLAGRHQVDNALAVLHVCDVLRAKGWRISQQAVCDGLAGVRFPGRLEQVSDRPLLLLDGAHNAGGVAALCSALDSLTEGRALYLVIGMAADKAVKECVPPLACRARKVFAAAPQNERALPSAELAALAARDCPDVQDCGTLSQALRAARAAASAEDCILVCGSLYLVGEAEKLLEGRHESAE